MGTAKPRLLVFIVAYFAERTLDKVIRRIPHSLGDEYHVEILIIDDSSKDETFTAGTATDRSGDIPFKITVLYNPVNQGYGGNQKIGYHYAIENGFDFVALLHGDGQYAPEKLGDLTAPLRTDDADAVFGSRMMRPRAALKGGMPLYKYVGNRILTRIQNRLLGTQLSEFHSGYRAYSVAALKALPFVRNSNVFHFDTEIIIQLIIARKRIKEIPIPTYYGDEISRVSGITYAANVLKASLQALFQRVNLFYDRRFDCEPPKEGQRYPSKLDFSSSHSRVIELVPHASRVLDLGSGMGTVGAALKEHKGCFVVGCDIDSNPMTQAFDRFVSWDLNQGPPDVAAEPFDYILLLDVIEHLSGPEDFLDALRTMAAKTGATVIITTANIGFVAMRISLLAGRFEYSKRGILDLTHHRLFTMRTLRRALIAAGFDVQATEGVAVPVPFVFGDTGFSTLIMGANRLLVRLWPALFGFELFAVAKARPTLETLLLAAAAAADRKVPAPDRGK